MTADARRNALLWILLVVLVVGIIGFGVLAYKPLKTEFPQTQLL